MPSVKAEVDERFDELDDVEAVDDALLSVLLLIAAAAAARSAASCWSIAATCAADALVLETDVMERLLQGLG